MEAAPDSFRQLTAGAKEIARRLLTIGANRLELLRVEVQEERVLLLHAIFLSCGIAALALLAGIAFTAVMVVLFFDTAPVAVLLGLTGLYGAAAVLLCLRLRRMLRAWQNLPASFEQFKKDRACLEAIINSRP